MADVCVLGPATKNFEEKAIIRECKRYFASVLYAEIPEVVIDSKKRLKVCYKNVLLDRFDCIIARIPRTYANHGYIVAKLLAGKTKMTAKPDSIVISHNKFLTLMELSKAGIRVPHTYLSSTGRALESALDRLHYPVVMKLLYGSKGKGVMFADSRASAMSMVDTIEAINQPIFVEEYFKEGRRDMRLVVVGDEVVAAMERIAKPKELRSNIAAGGEGRKFDPPEELKEIAVKTAKVLGLNIAGIDVIKSKGRYYVIEANMNVIFEGATKATGVNIAGRIAKYAKSMCKK